MDEINLFGGNGFIGTIYKNKSKFKCISNERNDLLPKSNKLLYMVSTVDNYSVLVNPYIDIETNLTTLMRVLEKIPKNNTSEINFISSWFVYGNTEDLPAKENSYCNPKGFYSITKRTAEQLLISYCETFNINYRILRLANVLGKGDKKVSNKKNALTYLINKIKNNEKIELYNSGNFYRDYIYIDDVVDAIDIVIKFGELNTIYNIGNGIPIYFKDIINYAIKKTNSKSVIKNIEPSNFHKIVQVNSMYMDCSKLYNLGYQQKYGIYEIIDMLIDLKLNGQ